MQCCRRKHQKMMLQETKQKRNFFFAFFTPMRYKCRQRGWHVFHNCICNCLFYYSNCCCYCYLAAVTAAVVAVVFVARCWFIYLFTPHSEVNILFFLFQLICCVVGVYFYKIYINFYWEALMVFLCTM